MNICESKNCSHCCLKASVPLLNEDIDRIIQLGYYDAYFADEREGVKFIRTWSDGSCIFFDKETNSCQVYDYRPKQCKLRPYTINGGSQQPGIDDECIYHLELSVESQFIKEMSKYFETLKSEIEWRRKTGYF
jgi:Fe-S-cluster containining protein